MSAKPAAIPLFGDAYLADTRHLTTEEHGAYLLLMMAAWRQDDCGLPNDDRKLARITGLTARKWASIKPTIMEFWQVENDRIFQGRLRKERVYVDQKSESNRKSAEARWSKQATENKQTDACERISERNAPPPLPPQEVSKKKELAAEAACPSEPDEPEIEADPNLRPEHVFERWNDAIVRLGKPRVRDITPSRRNLLKARIGQYTIDDFMDVFGKVERSPFLRGDTGWHGCNFDWVFKRANFQKILEGNYDH